MTPRTLDAARGLIRIAAAKRPGEKQAAAFDRTAALLSVSAATVANIWHGEIDACSEEKASQILALRRAVLQDRLDFQIRETERHQAETERLLNELHNRGESECWNGSETGWRGWLSAPRVALAASLDGSEADSPFLFWGVAT